MPTVSVIVPIYNVEKYVHRCVDSILEQTYSDFELILVGDGSTDNCCIICDEYAEKDSRVQVIHKKNGGVADARNTGIKWAKDKSDSEWISLIDSDDWVHANFLENLLGAAHKHDTVISCCYFQMIRNNEVPTAVGEFVTHLCSPEDIYCSRNNNGVDSYAWRFLYQKSLFKDVEYPKGKIYEDLFTTHRLIFKTNVISVVEQPLYYYFQHDDSIVHSKWTHKQLDRLEAYEMLICFFENSGKRVERCVKRGYISAIHSNYLQVSKNDLCKLKRRNVTILRRKMRNALFLYAKDVGINFSTHNYLYTIAYPKLLAIYWHIRSLVDKLNGK